MQSGDADRDETRQTPKGTGETLPRSIWRVPPPVQRLFDRFPLRIYPSNELPLRAPRNRNRNVLHIFATSTGAAEGAPSFNPGCLKWQAFLSFNNVPFQTVASTNHASPSGALPFLLPAASTSLPSGPATTPDPIPTSKLESWIQSTYPQTPKQPRADPSLAAYSALLSHPIRLAYLYALYLHPDTFTATAVPLYIDSSSRSALVRLSLQHPLREAALAELLTTSSAPYPRIDASRLLQEADDAFGALSTLLGDAPWIGCGAAPPTAAARVPTKPSANERTSKTTTTTTTTTSSSSDELDQGRQQRDSELGLFDDGDDHGENGATTPPRQQQQQPGMLDAALFAYTYVILLLFAEERAGSPARELCWFVEKRGNLVRHRERVLGRYFAGGGAG